MPDLSAQMDAVCHRFEELSVRLNQPDAAADPALFRKLMRDYHETQPVQRILKSMPTRSTSKLCAPQGCFLRVRMVSPTAMSIFIRPLPSFLPRKRPAEPVCAAAR